MHDTLRPVSDSLHSRMFQVDIAARYGAVGIIIYSDPADCTGQQMGDSRVYPETWWLPPTGAQRGTIFTGDGDPITPGYPANGLSLLELFITTSVLRVFFVLKYDSCMGQIIT